MKFFIIPLISIFIFSCSKKQEVTQQKSSTVSVDAMILQPETFENKLEVSGSILANEYVELKFEVSGRIISLHIPEGNVVQKGALLATLFNDDLKAQQEKLHTQLLIAQQTEQRLKALLDKNGVSRQEYDNALNTVQSLEADIQIVKAQIQKTQLTAPFTGMVGLRNVSVGAYVSPENVITTIQETGKMKVDFVVPENQSSVIQKNNTVQILSGKENYTATILAIEPQINTTTRNIKVRAVLNERHTALQPGAFAKVLIPSSDKSTAFIIPSNAIIPDSRGNMVVLIKNGKAKFQFVQTGVRHNNWVEISEGVEKNDTVAVNGILYLRPDADVQIKGIKTVTELGYETVK